jgi:hypothetical protein
VRGEGAGNRYRRFLRRAAYTPVRVRGKVGVNPILGDRLGCGGVSVRAETEEEEGKLHACVVGDCGERGLVMREGRGLAW